MWIVRAICDEGYSKAELNVYRVEDLETAKKTLEITYKGTKAVVEEYIPWSKERAEEEIRQKKIKLGLIKEKKPKTRKKKSKE